MARKRLRSGIVHRAPESGVARALRLRRKGQDRRATLALRDLCNMNSDNARFWALYAAQCERTGQFANAREAYTRAAWLRERQRDPVRAEVLRRLAQHVNHDAA